MNPLATLIGIVLVVALVIVVAAALFRFVTIHDYERGLRYANGRFRGLLGQGTHLSMPPFREIRVFDARPVHQVLEGQEVLTADSVAVRISLVVRYVVADPVAAVAGDQDYRRALYLTIQLALRGAVAATRVDELLTARPEVARVVMDRAAPELARLGIEVLAVEIRDVMLPADLKRAFAAVVAARKEGEASLERARGETAALRNLANAAQMLEDHPGLVQLRALQTIAESSGNTVTIGIPDGVARVPPVTSPEGAPNRRRRAAAEPD